MNGKIKFHKATGPAFNAGEVWYAANGRMAEIVDVARYLGVLSNHTSDYSVMYKDVQDGTMYEKDAWNFQVRYTHQADRLVG
jgi:ABC-type molybdate transport system substrate-binding protein